MDINKSVAKPWSQSAALSEQSGELDVMPTQNRCRWEHFAHGADIGIRGIGLSMAQAFEQAARAMTAAMVDPDIVATDAAVEISCSGHDPADLFYTWLNAVVFEMAIRRMIFGRFDVKIHGLTLHAVAWGERVSPSRHEPAVEIKGATLTGLQVRYEDSTWIAECIVDV